MTQIAVIGGSDAGISTGLRARAARPGVEVTAVVTNAYPNHYSCGRSRTRWTGHRRTPGHSATR